MQSLNIQDTRLFMSHLLSRDTFNQFCLTEAQITTFATFIVDGRFHADYFDSGTYEEGNVPAFARWEQLQPHIYQLVKGHVTPLSMKIVLRLPDAGTAKLAQAASGTVLPEQVNGLYLNITYDRQNVICTTGTSLSVFTMDKSLEHLWDERVMAFFRQNRIPFTIC